MNEEKVKYKIPAIDSIHSSHTLAHASQCEAMRPTEDRQQCHRRRRFPSLLSLFSQRNSSGRLRSNPFDVFFFLLSCAVTQCLLAFLPGVLSILSVAATATVVATTVFHISLRITLSFCDARHFLAAQPIKTKLYIFPSHSLAHCIVRA